jgi:hypothetical protein
MDSLFEGAPLWSIFWRKWILSTFFYTLFLSVILNIVLSTPKSSKMSLSFWMFDKIFVCTPSLHIFLPFADSLSSDLNVHGFVHRKNILIYTQQDATLHSLFCLETVLHVSGGTFTHHQKRKQLYLQHLVFVTPDAVVTIVCSPDHGW